MPPEVGSACQASAAIEALRTSRNAAGPAVLAFAVSGRPLSGFRPRIARPIARSMGVAVYYSLGNGHHADWNTFIRSEQGHAMDIEQLEVYATDSNYAIIKPHGRKYPGCVIQGDSLAILCRLAQDIAACARDGDTMSESFLADVQEVTNSLLDRMLHYQSVLSSHGIDLPYSRPFSESDFVRLLPDDEDE